MAFAHLHVHTEFSLLDGSNRIKDYVSRVKELGMNAAAITDHGVMYGCIDFYNECMAQGIRPILGCEVYVAPGSRFDRESGYGEDRYYHLILLCENNIGYQNLMRISSIGFTEGYYYKPRVDREVLAKYNQGLICCSACLAGEVQKLLARGLYDEAKEAALWHRDTFGEGSYFLELQDHGLAEQQTVNQQLMRLSRETGIGLVATNDAHYTRSEDAEAHDLLLCIQTGKTVSDTDRMRYDGGQYFIKSEEEMRAIFPYAPEALENTQKIADRCEVKIEFNNYKLPHFDVPKGYDSLSYLRELCEKGLHSRYDRFFEDRDTYEGYTYQELEEKLNYELKVIASMGFVDYFLIVWDFIRYARDNGIAVGPGRGSAAGSIVSYSIGITNIDPVRYQLIFERFLNPGRVSMPDIDIDFCVDRRGEVIDYVMDKYGRSNVTQIVTFGTLLARGVVRDVARVLDEPYSTGDLIAKKIPKELGITLKDALRMNPELRGMYESDQKIHYLLDMSMKLEGLSRHSGVHAAGVVIAPGPMYEFVPVAVGAEGNVTTQYTKDTVESLGLLKMDFLGLQNLTIIQDALSFIEENHGVTIDFDTMEYDDKRVFELMGSGRTEGVFQLESAGMKSFMKDLRPQNLEDVIAGISLYRPGPMDFIPAYIRGKNNQDLITYDCPQLKPILEPTYGCIVYQEQVMQIVRDLAGFDMARSDEVRRYMSKKKMDKMKKERQNFVYGNEEEGIPGCISNGIDVKVAEKIYDELIEFSKYAFNKSHAAAYAVVAYQTAYLKVHYPVEYMAALMTRAAGEAGKISEYISHARSMGIDILPPYINQARGGFSAGDGAIRFGLAAIKNVGTGCVAAIIRERELNGPYRSLDDFIRRVNTADVNKRAVENLIKAGAFDNLGANRRQMVMIHEALMDSAIKGRKNVIEGQISLFDIVDEDQRAGFEVRLPQVPEFSKEELLSFEKEVIGIYLSGHPLEDYAALLDENVTAHSNEFALPEAGEEAEDGEESLGEIALPDGSKAVIGGIISDVTIKYTKNGSVMAFITVEDLFGDVEVIVFPRQYERYRELLELDAKVFVAGKVSTEENKNGKLISEMIVAFDNLPRELWVRYDDIDAYKAGEAELFGLLSEMPGDIPVFVFLSKTRQVKKLPPGLRTALTEEGQSRLKSLVGEGNVNIRTKKLTPGR